MLSKEKRLLFFALTLIFKTDATGLGIPQNIDNYDAAHFASQDNIRGDAIVDPRGTEPLFTGIPDQLFKTTTDEDTLNWLTHCLEHKHVARAASFDGGGIRGIIPATMIEHIERSCGKKMTELFHFFAGTSTGGLIATMLAIKKKASDIASLYRERGANLFKKIPFIVRLFQGFRAKYDTRPLKEIIRTECGERKLSDIDSDILITYYNLTKREPEFFKSHFARIAVSNAKKSFDLPSVESFATLNTPINDDAPQNSTSKAHSIVSETAAKILYDYSLEDVLNSTICAPTYFDIYHFQSGNGQITSALDGGLHSNDPTLCSLIEMARLYSNADAYFLMSFGTGKKEQVQIADPKSLLAWATTAPDLLMGSAESMVKHMIKTLGVLYRKPVFFVKIQIPLPKEHAAMDNTSRKNLRYLMQASEEYIRDPDSPLNKVLPLLNIPLTARDDLVSDNAEGTKSVETNFFEIGRSKKAG